MNYIFIEVIVSQPCIQLMLPEQFQSHPQMFHMFFLILRISKNAIKENKNNLSRYLLKTLFMRYMNVVSALVPLQLIRTIPFSEDCLMKIFILDPYFFFTVILFNFL